MFICDICKRRIKRGEPFADMDFSYKQVMTRQSFSEHMTICDDCWGQIMDLINDISEEAEDED